MGKVFECALKWFRYWAYFLIKLFYFISCIYIYVYIFLECMHMYHICTWCPGGWKRTLCSLEWHLWIVMSQHVSGGNWTHVLFNRTDKVLFTMKPSLQPSEFILNPLNSSCKYVLAYRRSRMRYVVDVPIKWDKDGKNPPSYKTTKPTHLTAGVLQIVGPHAALLCEWQSIHLPFINLNVNLKAKMINPLCSLCSAEGWLSFMFTSQPLVILFTGRWIILLLNSKFEQCWAKWKGALCKR